MPFFFFFYPSYLLCWSAYVMAGTQANILNQELAVTCWGWWGENDIEGDGDFWDCGVVIPNLFVTWGFCLWERNNFFSCLKPLFVVFYHSRLNVLMPDAPALAVSGPGSVSCALQVQSSLLPGLFIKFYWNTVPPTCFHSVYAGVAALLLQSELSSCVRDHVTTNLKHL